MSDVSGDAVTVKQPRSVFLSPAKVARLSFSSVDCSAAAELAGALSAHAAAAETEPEAPQAGSGVSRTCSHDALVAHPLDQPLDTTSLSPRPVAHAAHAGKCPSAPSCSHAVDDRRPLQHVQLDEKISSPTSCAAAHASTSAALALQHAGSGSASGSDHSPQLVSVLRGSCAPPTSQLTAALAGLAHSASTSTAADPLAISDGGAAAKFGAEHCVGALASPASGEQSPASTEVAADYIMVDRSADLAQNGTPSGSLGSLKDGLLQRFKRLHSPKGN